MIGVAGDRCGGHNNLSHELDSWPPILPTTTTAAVAAAAHKGSSNWTANQKGHKTRESTRDKMQKRTEHEKPVRCPRSKQCTSQGRLHREKGWIRLGLITSTVNFEHWMEHKRHTNRGRYNISLRHKSTLNMQLGRSGERIDRISVSGATHMLPLFHPRVTPMTSR